MSSRVREWSHWTCGVCGPMRPVLPTRSAPFLNMLHSAFAQHCGLVSITSTPLALVPAPATGGAGDKTISAASAVQKKDRADIDVIACSPVPVLLRDLF